MSQRGGRPRLTKWDEVAEVVREAAGEWVPVEFENVNRRGPIKQALGIRGSFQVRIRAGVVYVRSL